MAETLTPAMDPGKAAAFDRWMAQGGNLPGMASKGRGGKKAGIYAQGPQKGMTWDQAYQKFEQMWGSASPEIRAKYAARASGTAAQKPVGNAELNAARPGETPSQMYARQRASRMGGAVAPTSAVKPGRASVDVPAPTPTPDPVAIGTDEERARVAAMLQEGGQFATADAGGGASMAASQAMYARNQAQDEALKRGVATPDEVGSVKADEAKRNADAIAKREAEIQAAKQAEIAKTREAAGLDPAPTTPKPPGPFANAKRRGGTSVSGQQGRISTGGSPSSPVEMREEAANVAEKPWQNVEGQPDPRPVPRPMPDQVAATTATPTPAQKPGINRLTGLPFGYRPGDAVGPAQAKAALDSESAQGSASAFGGIEARPSDLAAADNAMRSQGMVIRPQTPTPTPAQRPQSPTAPGGAFGADAYARSAAAQQLGNEQAAIRAGTASEATRAKHPDLVKKMTDDTKFWAGKPMAAPAPTTLQKPNRFAMARR